MSRMDWLLEIRNLFGDMKRDNNKLLLKDLLLALSQPRDVNVSYTSTTQSHMFFSFPTRECADYLSRRRYIGRTAKRLVCVSVKY